jgi:hypothetical protein
MAKGGPAAVAAEIIQNYPVDATPRELKEVVVEIALNAGWFESEDLAAELTDAWVGRVETRLRAELAVASSMGRPSSFAFNSISEYLIQGSAHPEGSDSPEVVESKLRRSSSARYLELLSAISPRQFEGVCRGILGILGCDSPFVSDYSADQGIDFYGRLHLAGRLGNANILGSIDRSISMWIVGQAKHYSATQVSTPHLRELVGSVELAKAKAYAGSVPSLLELEIAALDPVLFLFITTGKISRDAWILIERSGMVAMDGLTVPTFLADNGVGLVDGELSASAFMAWVDSHLD